jgi:hypothetical protein
VHRAKDEHFELARQVGSELRRPRDVRRRNGVHQIVGVRPFEGPPPRCTLVKHDAERVLIGALGHELAAANLLGRHVVRRPEQRFGMRERLDIFFVEDLGNAEVDDRRVHDASGEIAYQDVRRLQVAMDDRGAVGRSDRRCDGQEEVGDLSAREFAARRKKGREIGALEKLHHDVRRAIFGADVEDVDDVVVADLRGRPRLAEEARRRVGFSPHIDVHDFERDVLAEGYVHRFVNRGHAPAPDLAHD